MPRRRLSSDGFKLFNIAHVPERSKIREMLSCLFRTEYDDRLEEMTHQCEVASRQLYGYNTDPIKKKMINHFIDNSIFNVIYAILCKDEQFASMFQVKQNYRYFMDIMFNAFNSGDHNTTIMLRQALEHHALKQLKIPLRKKDRNLIRQMEEEYGTWRDCYAKHLKNIMMTTDLDILPSMMVLQMHLAKHRIYTQHGRCKYTPDCIEGKIGIYGLQNISDNYNEALPLYEEPPINKSSDLILIAQQVL